MSGDHPAGSAGGLRVRGGPRGHSARTADLLRFSSIASRAAAAVSAVAEELAWVAGHDATDPWPAAVWSGVAAWSGVAPWPPGPVPDPGLVEGKRRLGEIAWRRDGLRRTAEQLSGLSARARLVAEAFGRADASAAAAFDGLSWTSGFVLGRVGAGLLPPPMGAGSVAAGAPSADLLGGGIWIGSGVLGGALVTGRPGAAQLVTGLVPGLVSGGTPLRSRTVAEVALAGLGAARLSPWLRSDGEVVLLPASPGGTGPGAAVSVSGPPRTVADVVGLLEIAGAGGRSVVVERIDAPDGRRSWVVAVPGVQTWTPRAGSDPYDLTAAVRAMAGRRPAVAVHLAEALDAAGARPGEPVLLAGHSLGGMAVAQAAADPAFRSRFRVTHVLTAGSPVAQARVPAQIRVLSLEHEEDVVPALDGADNPDRARWVTVRASASEAPEGRSGVAGFSGHDVRAYRWTAGRVDLAGPAVLDGWRQGFEAFAVPGARVRRWRFGARRTELDR